MALTAEQLEIRAMAREFAAGEIRPHVEEWDARRALPEEILGKLAELGFLGLRAPEDHGGLDLDLVTSLLAVEALSWGDASVGLTAAIHNGPVTRALVAFGSPGQQEAWLPKLASGEAIGAFALSEEEAGSDPAALVCAARPSGEGWILSGGKRWVTNGERAGLLLVFARTGEGRDGISAFLVDRSLPGIEVVGRERTLGLSASESITLRFQDVALPGDALLGGEGRGWKVAADALVVGRLMVAAQSLGVAEAAFEHSLRYAGEREQFGTPLSGFGAIQEKLAGMAQRIAQSRALLHQVAGEVESGEPVQGGSFPRSPSARAAMSKVAASETAMWVSDEAVQIFGGYGYMRDYPVEKLMRDAKGTEIYEGTNEVLRWLVARDAIREAGEG
jgi:acyl-CoA dehydrogenase